MGSFADGHGDVFTFTKSYTDESGNKVKGENIRIPFKERLTSPKLAEIAEFKKFIFDLEKPGRRYALEKALERVNEGKELTDDELKELEIESKEELTTALEKSNKKRYEFISAGWIITNQLVYTVAASRRGHTTRLRQVLNSLGVMCYYTFSDTLL